MSVNQSYGDLITADLSIAINNPGSLMKQFNKWMNNGGEMPTYEEEYLCLYCGSPNKIENTHCMKCGAPRSFVIG